MKSYCKRVSERERNAVGQVFLTCIEITAEFEVWTLNNVNSNSNNNNENIANKEAREKSDSIKSFFDMYILQGADNTEKIWEFNNFRLEISFSFSSPF